MSSTRPANHHRIQDVGDSTGQPPNRLSERHCIRAPPSASPTTNAMLPSPPLTEVDTQQIRRNPFSTARLTSTRMPPEGQKTCRYLADPIFEQDRRGCSRTSQPRHPSPQTSPSRSRSGASGLRRLGLPDQVMAGFAAEFIQGMANSNRSRFLGDVGESDPRCWEWARPDGPPVDGLLMLYATDPDLLERGRPNSGSSSRKTALPNPPSSRHANAATKSHSGSTTASPSPSSLACRRPLRRDGPCPPASSSWDTRTHAAS